MTTRSLELSDAISALMVQQPFYAVLLFDMLEVVETDAADPSIQTAATDGAKIYVNPAYFKTISVQERIGVIAHEITHVVLRHCERTKGYIDLGVGPDLKPFNPRKMNHAQDYIINQMLTDAGLKLPLGALFNPQITADDICDEVYLKIPDPPEDEDNFDQHIPGDQANTPDKATVQRALKMAASAATQQGLMPAGLQRLVDDVCEPQIKWTDYVKRSLVTMSGHDEQSYVKPNRRRLANAPHIYWPGRIGSRAGIGGICVDTSGSTSDEMQTKFFAEIHGVLQDCMPEKVHVGFVDAALHGGFHEIEDVNDLLDLRGKVLGGGGTDLPVFWAEAEKEGIEMDWMIILTDGYTPFGDDPGIPTIWCMTTDVVAPWGLTVRINV